MPQIITGSQIRRSAPAHRCYYRPTWGDDWIELPYLFCLEASKTINPSIGSAVFEWRFGRGKQHDSDQIEEFVQIGLTNQYVKVEIDQVDADGNELDPLVWIGIVVDDLTTRHGALEFEGLKWLTGQQHLVAYSLEYLLERTRVRSSWVHKRNGSEVQVHRGLTFNEPHQRAGQGNRSRNRGSRGAYLFEENLDEAQHWTTFDAVQYLLTYHAPANEAGDILIPWELSLVSDVVLPRWDQPIKPTHGKTLKRLIDELIDRRRALGWWVEVEAGGHAGGDTIVVNTIPFNEAVLNLPGGGIQIPNGNNVSIDFDASLDAHLSPLRESAAHSVDQVQVIGHWVRTCFTMRDADVSLASNWSGTEESAYDQAASLTAGYAALDIDDKQQLNILARSRDELKRVYEAFKLEDLFFGIVQHVGTEDDTPIIPDNLDQDQDDQDNDTGDPEEFYWPGLRFESFLPIEDKAVHGAGDPEPQWLPPICLVRTDPDPAVAAIDAHYQHVDKLALLAGVESVGGGNGFEWSGHLRMAPDHPGFTVSVSGGKQHMLAADEFVPLPDDEPAGSQVRWQDMLVTVFMRLDREVRQSWPPQPAAVDTLRVMQIELGERARLDYVTPGTVVGIDAEGKLVLHAGGFVADDRLWMRDLAQLAYEWYGVPRLAFDLAFRQITGAFALGDLIEEIGADETTRETNSVVTSIRWNLADGFTQIHTDFAELDPIAFIPERLSRRR